MNNGSLRLCVFGSLRKSRQIFMDQQKSTITLFEKQNNMYSGERLRNSFFCFGSSRMKLSCRTERRRIGGDDNQAFITSRRCCGRRLVSSLLTKNARPAFHRVSNVRRPAKEITRNFCKKAIGSNDTSRTALAALQTSTIRFWKATPDEVGVIKSRSNAGCENVK